VPLPEKPPHGYRGPGRLRQGPFRREMVHAFTAQVLLWAPQTFPTNPEQFSHGLFVRVYADGTVTGTPYGPRDNMRVSVKTRVVESGPGVDRHVVIDFPFVIEGL